MKMMAMKDLFFPVLCSFFVFSVAAQDDLPPLERALGGVVTVGVFDVDDEPRPLGFGRKGKSNSDIAYEKSLNMAGAYSSGSGFVIDHEGTYYVITNSHVTDAASDKENAISIYTITRQKYPVRVVGGDSFYDIAILAFDGVEPGEEIEPLVFSKGGVQLAQAVYAIGNPLGEYPYTITEGIISGKNRLFHRPATGRYGFLQHTATLIWGNSGGPLVNEAGEVVGINTWIKTRNQDGQNYLFSQLNFALEGSLAAELIEELIDNQGRLRRAYLGIEFATRQSYLEPESPPFIKGFLDDSPAGALLAGRVEYTVLAINGQPVTTLQDIVRILEGVDPGQEVTIKLKKGINAPEATIPAEEFTAARLEDVAQYFFRTYTDYEARDSSGAVALVHKKAKGKPRIESVQAEEGAAATFALTEGQSRYSMVAAGHLDQYGRASLYRVRNLQDLGTVIRLCTLEGHLGATLAGGEEATPESVRIFLEDEELNELKILYY
jgi:S1-C subfamily serine protease